MTRLPYVGYTGGQRLKAVGTFAGLNKQLIASENEFSDMENVSTRFYPAIGTRERRGTIQANVPTPRGLYYKNGLFYVSGTHAYYNGEEIGVEEGAETGALENSTKQLAGMGAYIVIWPDKKVFNTSTGELKDIETSWTSSGDIVLKPFSKDSAFTCIYADGINDAFSQYDAITLSGFSGNYEDLNSTKVIQQSGTDGVLGDYIVVTYAMTLDDDTESVTVTSTITATRSAPDMDYICESGNRIWGCSSDHHEIYASKLGDPTNWNSFEGISTDSYAATVGSDEDFTGCIGHLGYVLFFKENTIHKLMGSKPSSFQLNTYQLPGVRDGCSASLQIVNETLYYVGRDGVYTYDGASPQMISKCFGDLEIERAVCGQQDGKLYLSGYAGGEWRLYVFDPEIAVWVVEDSTQFRLAAYGAGSLYIINRYNSLQTIKGDKSERIHYMLESVDIQDQTLRNKYISRILLNVWLTAGSVMEFSMKYDDSPQWERKGQITATKNMTYTMPIVPKRCSKFRWKIEGYGDFKLIGFGRYIEEGSEQIRGIMEH